MGCNTLALISSPVATGTSNIKHGLHRSKSTKNLGRETTLRRCFSENHICYNNNSSISASSTKTGLKSSKSTGALPFQLSSSILPSSVQSLLFDSETSNNMSLVEERDIDIDGSDEVGTQEEEIKRSNWIEKLLEIRSHWLNRQPVKRTEEDDELEKDEIGGCGDDDDEGGCEVSYSSDEDEENQETEVNYDRGTFSKLLDKVSSQETRLFSQLAFLCNIAYVIPTIKPEELWDIFRLKLVTSSVDKKAEAAAINEKLELDSTCIPGAAASAESTDSNQRRVMKNSNETCSPSVAYDIAVTAATYVQQNTEDLRSFDLEAQEEGYGDGEQIQEEERNPHRRYKSDVSAYDMATSTMIAVVAAGEKEKQEAAQDLQSPHSSPCEWFICDDSNVRYFVIQGSDSSASWQANLLFEPTQFEGTDGIVHRGIYVAAKGIYKQFLPEVMSHLEKYGPDSKFQFTGHSLGGSLALLVTLMLLKRGILKPSNLQPVVTFGSPFIFCGGHKILKQLGVDDNLVRSVIMHRDIVPRAFACSYPNQIASLLKRLNGSFRSHPCLIRKKLLYSPVGKVFILQPDEKSSPSHPLLPEGNALYLLDKNRRGYSMAALRTFLNRPHPIITLSNPRAYGSDGTILRDHDSSNYLKAVNGVLRQQMKPVGFGGITTRKQGNDDLWPLLTSPSLHSWSHRSNLSSVNKEVFTGV